MRVMVLIAIVLAACVSARTADAEQIQNRGKCLSVRGNRAANGTPIILWHCTGGTRRSSELRLHEARRLMFANGVECATAGHRGRL